MEGKKGIILVDSAEKALGKELSAVRMLFEKTGMEIEAVEIDDIMVVSEDDFDGKIFVKGEERDCPDFALMGAFTKAQAYHSQAVLRMLDSVGVLCVNSSDAMQITKDKLYTFQVAKKVVPEIKIPKTVLVTGETRAADIGKVTGYPVVLKVLQGSMGRGIALVNTERELDDLLGMIFAAPYGDQIIAQEAIMSSKGRDLRLIIADGQVFHSFVRRNDSSFKSNVKQGGYLENFDAPEDLKEMSVKIANAVGLKIGSVDYLFGEKEGEYYLCEANSMPGLTYVFEAKEQGNKEFLKRVLEIPKQLFASHPTPAWKEKKKD